MNLQNVLDGLDDLKSLDSNFSNDDLTLTIGCFLLVSEATYFADEPDVRCKTLRMTFWISQETANVVCSVVS